jgi:hypothetical protein
MSKQPACGSLIVPPPWLLQQCRWRQRKAQINGGESENGRQRRGGGVNQAAGGMRRKW